VFPWDQKDWRWGLSKLNNLHISLNEFRNASRVLKQTQSIVDHDIASHVFIAALGADDLEMFSSIGSRISLNRFKLSTRCLSKKLFFQVVKYLEFILRICFYYRKKNIGMVNIHTLALLPLGVLFKYCYGTKLIYDTHELETETSGLKGFRKWLAKKMEHFLIRYCDQVFVVSESIADWYVKEYTIQRPTVVLNSPSFREISSTIFLRSALNISADKIIFLYQGGLVVGRGVDLILEVFKQLDGGNSVVVFMGYGQLEQEIKTAAAIYENIYFYPAVHPDVVLDYTSSADVGIHLIKNTCLNHYYCMPNKLFEYIMAGLPVIVSNMLEMSSFVGQYELGIVADIESIESIILAIEKIQTMDISMLKKNALNASNKFCWQEQEYKMIEVYRRLLGGTNCNTLTTV